MYSHYGEQYRASLEEKTKLNHEVPYDSAIPLLSIYPKEMIPAYQRDAYMYTTPQLIIAEIRNQPSCPLMDERTNNMWYMYTMEHYSVIKRNEILLFTVKWIEMEDIMLKHRHMTYIRSRQTNITCTHMCGSYKMSSLM
jgi:hypothetical protein